MGTGIEERWHQLEGNLPTEPGTGHGPWLRSVVKFGVVGVVNTGVYYGCYLLLRLALPYFEAHLAALAAAMVVSFFLNCYWTFRTRPTWRKFLLFPLTNVTNYVMITAGVVVLVEWLHVDTRIAPLIAAAAAIPVTFLLSRKVLLGRPGPAADVPVSSPMERRRRTG